MRRRPPAEHAVLSELHHVSDILFSQLKMASYRQRSAPEPSSGQQILSPGQRMSRILARFDDATNLFLGVMNDVDPVGVGRGRSFARNGGGVAVVIDDACIQSGTLFEGCKV